jgi:hypothetical protein
MVTFPSGDKPSKELYRPDEILGKHSELGGADIFTYQANLTFNLGPVQLYLSDSLSLWDIDAKGKYYAYEYGDGLLVSTRDRVNTILGQISFDLRPHSLFLNTGKP